LCAAHCSHSSSDSLSAFLNEARLSRPQTVKRIWDYVKANGLQDQSDKRYILCDDAMQTVFHTEKLHMFTYVLCCCFFETVADDLFTG
jgi:upstream activation factor subunit UAF30